MNIVQQRCRLERGDRILVQAVRRPVFQVFFAALGRFEMPSRQVVGRHGLLSFFSASPVKCQMHA